MVITQYYLDQLEKGFLSELAQFVVNENYQHHTNCGLETQHQSLEIQHDIVKVHNEELPHLKNSHFFVARDSSGAMKGSIRLLKWDYKQTLPIQEMFSIDPLKAIKSKSKAPQIWHIGRFAISKENNDHFLFKKLMLHAIKPICAEKNAYAFAECDAKLLKTMQKMGIKAQVVGKSIHHLGSETIPIYMSSVGLKAFYTSNAHLINAV